jgi:hypothetical protein
MLADNSSYLRAAARSKREATRRRALAALAKLEADATQVTATTLAKAAGVARSWIYTQPDLMERIAAALSAPRTPRQLERQTNHGSADSNWPTKGSRTSPRRTSNCAPN